MTDYLTFFINALLGAAATAIVAAAVAFIKYLGKKSKDAAHISKREWDALTIAVKASIHDQLHRYCRYLLPEDSLTEDEAENLEYLHEGYEALGLNGTGEKLYKQTIEKPIKYDK